MPPVPASALAALALGGLLAAMARRPVRQAMRNGLRCLARYPDLWHLPALFALGYALFQAAAAALLHLRLEEAFPVFAWVAPPPPAELAAAAMLPSLERAVAAFTVFPATFPLSAWFALRFLGNAGGLLAEFAKALRKRLGAARGILLALALVLTAVAAVAKPAVYLLLPETLAFTPLFVALGINALSSVFELLLGIFLLTYLMLMAYAWLRGLHFDRPALRLMAMRRTGFVLKWSLLIAALTALLVLAPAYLGLLVAPDDPLLEQSLWFATWIGRPLVTAAALLWLPAPAILVFHNESLRPALRDGRALLRRNWTTILPLLAAAMTAFLALEMAAEWLVLRLGGETLAAFGARAAGAWLEGGVTGWLIASWVCLYKGFSTGRKEVLF